MVKRKTSSDNELMEVIYNELKYGEFKNRYTTVNEIRDFLKRNDYSYNHDLILKLILVLMFKGIVEIKRQIMWENAYIYTYIKYIKGKNLILKDITTNKIRVVM